MSCEIELKLKIPDDVSSSEILENPLISKHLVTSPEKIEMKSTYFDTAENALGRARASIRTRLENGNSVVTLKCAKSSDGALARRGEWEVCADSVEAALPELAKTDAPREILNLVEKSTLITVAQFSFLRETAVLDCGDFSAHICVDIGYLSSDGIKKTPLRELELELISGDEGALRTMGTLLCTTFSMCEERLSKLTRARNL